jgi:hypothetical protein
MNFTHGLDFKLLLVFFSDLRQQLASLPELYVAATLRAELALRELYVSFI